MLENLKIFNASQMMARHAVAKQSAISQNIANADTPDYRAKDVTPFQELYTNPETSDMRYTRAKHALTDTMGAGIPKPEITYRHSALSPNGNSVSLESEMLAAASAKKNHDVALAIYGKSLSILKASLGRR